MCKKIKNKTFFTFWFYLFGVYRPTREFFTHHYRWRAANSDLCSACMAIEQWGFFSVPHLLWPGASVYNGHFQVPVTLTPNAERLEMERLLHCTCFNDLRLSRLGFEHPTVCLRGQRSYPLRHRLSTSEPDIISPELQ